jgi:hypothetical protein
MQGNINIASQGATMQSAEYVQEGGEDRVGQAGTCCELTAPSACTATLSRRASETEAWRKVINWHVHNHTDWHAYACIQASVAYQDS